MQWNIRNKYTFFLLAVTSGWGGNFYWLCSGCIGFEVNHDDTKTCNSVRVLHFQLVTKFLKFQLIEILWTAGANAYRKQENSFYLKLFLYKVYLVLYKFIMF